MNQVVEGDCVKLAAEIPDNSIDILVTSPPYWGQRLSAGMGTEEDPREYLAALNRIFVTLLPKLKLQGICWINLGDSYNTPVNWRRDDWQYSSLGPDKTGFHKDNAAYTKPRAKRKAFIERETNWLTYGNLLALPNRLVISLCDNGYVYRGEVIWRKKNAMPEGRCRRPHRQHESIFLLARDDDHCFRVSPPVGSVWEFSNERIDGPAHFSRFPEELPRRCIEAYGNLGPDTVVLDLFQGREPPGWLRYASIAATSDSRLILSKWRHRTCVSAALRKRMFLFLGPLKNTPPLDKKAGKLVVSVGKTADMDATFRRDPCCTRLGVDLTPVFSSTWS